MEDIDYEIQDAVLERPHVFRIDGETFYIYPMTLGKIHLMQRISGQLGMVKENLEKNAMLEILRIVEKNKSACCDLLSYLTARNDYYSVFDYDAFDKRKTVFIKQDDSELAALVMKVLSSDRTEHFIKHLGIDTEQKDMQKVTKVKSASDKNSFTFGGVSVYGTLLDVAMERYKMSKRQVVWEIDYTSLRLLLADRVNSVYVTDDERKKIHISMDRNKVDGDNRQAIMEAIRSQTWE